MDYRELANELIEVQGLMLQIPGQQKLSQLAMGSLFVLNYLAFTHDGIHPKELSEKMSVSTARIANLLNHLEGKKMVRRVPDAQDSRRIMVFLTETGREEIQHVREQILPSLCDMLERLGREDSENFIRILKKIWICYQD